MTGAQVRTNGELADRAVTRVKAAAGELAAYVREHPDEAAVLAAPTAALMAATWRHRLSPLEAAVCTEVGYWAGVLALRAYREWKQSPRRPRPHLRKVT